MELPNKNENFEKNLQGDVVAVYNSSGTKLASYTYDAWGKVTTTYSNGGASTGARYNPFRYRGYYYDDDTGLYYLNTRYYDPSMGRFINADIYVSTGQGIIGNNMYAYCNNNPVMYVDINGFAPQSIAEQALNYDGTYSLYDNSRLKNRQRLLKKNKVFFHEQALVFEPVKASGDVGNFNVAVGGSFTLATGGWEFENWDLSLLDMVQLTAGVGISPSHVEAEVGASLWSPSISFNLHNINVNISLSLGVEYGVKYGKKLFGVDFGVLGISLSR